MVHIAERRHGDVTDMHRYVFQGDTPANDRGLRSEKDNLQELAAGGRNIDIYIPGMLVYITYI